MLLLVAVQSGCGMGGPEGAALREPADDAPGGGTWHLAPIFVDDQPALVHSIPVTNTTRRAVHFTEVRQSCACTGTAKLGRTELLPGEKTTLDCDIDLRQRTGPQQFVFRLLDASGREWRYTLKTTLYRHAKFAAEGPTHFGMVSPRKQEVRRGEVRLYAHSADQLPRRVSFSAACDYLTVKSEPGSVSRKPDGIAVRTVPFSIVLSVPDSQGHGSASLRATIHGPGRQQVLYSTVTWYANAPRGTNTGASTTIFT